MKIIKEVCGIDWTCTDPDLQQYGRKISEGHYEFKEFNRNEYNSSGYCASTEFKESVFNEDRYWIEETIILKHYKQHEIESHISAYYNSLDELKEIYGEESEWIIAECIFEQNSGLY